MRLPYAGQAVVDLRKINGYLLSFSHPEGRAKARFFVSHGFSADRPEELVTALERHAREGRIRLSRQNIYGTIYTVNGSMQTPDGRNPTIDTVWIIESGAERPRLITAYPN